MAGFAFAPYVRLTANARESLRVPVCHSLRCSVAPRGAPKGTLHWNVKDTEFATTARYPRFRDTERAHAPSIIELPSHLE